jgi:hypothetical protein
LTIVEIPTLMLNGRYDFFYPVGTSQEPMFEDPGTPEPHKRHVIYDTGHSVPNSALRQEVLGWLDRYLGPVEEAIK